MIEALKEAVSELHLVAVTPIDRLGHANRPLNRLARRFLHRFIKLFKETGLSSEEKELAEKYLKELFLVRFKGSKGRFKSQGSRVK